MVGWSRTAAEGSRAVVPARFIAGRPCPGPTRRVIIAAAGARCVGTHVARAACWDAAAVRPAVHAHARVRRRWLWGRLRWWWGDAGQGAAAEVAGTLACVLSSIDIGGTATCPANITGGSARFVIQLLSAAAGRVWWGRRRPAAHLLARRAAARVMAAGVADVRGRVAAFRPALLSARGRARSADVLDAAAAGGMRRARRRPTRCVLRLTPAAAAALALALSCTTTAAAVGPSFARSPKRRRRCHS